MNSIPELNQTQTWLIVAILALSLILIARIAAKRKDKKNWLLMFLTIILAAGLLIFTLLGIRGIGKDKALQDLSDLSQEEVDEYTRALQERTSEYNTTDTETAND